MDMTITSKFPGKCNVCGGRIAVGEQIEWRKGEGSAHASCAKGGPAPTRTSAPKTPRAPSKPRGPAYPKSAPCDGAIEMRFVRRNARRGDQGLPSGHTMRIPNATKGGGADGCYWTTVCDGKIWPRNEDNGEYDPVETVWVRPATSDEAESLAAAKRRAEAPKTVAAYVERSVRAGEHNGDSEAATVWARRATGVVASVDLGSKASVVTVCLLTDGSILGYHGGHYDDYRASAWVVAAPSAALVQALRALASKDPAALAVAADACMTDAPMAVAS